jgi:hypothetical protein
MNEPNRFLDHVLKKFPYSSKPDQFQRLTKYFDAKGGGNAKQVRQQATIPDPTRRKIEASWAELTREERGFLLIQVGIQMLRADTGNLRDYSPET